MVHALRPLGRQEMPQPFFRDRMGCWGQCKNEDRTWILQELLRCSCHSCASQWEAADSGSDESDMSTPAHIKNLSASSI